MFSFSPQMGSSGAGKTTLMDVLALRKNSGDIVGDVRLNGHPQEEFSFRRCTGYVEQFDVQSSQLTIRETCEFSAKLRLESSSPEVTPESTKKFVDQTLYMLELTDIQDLQVGSDDSGGLSFEQRKRLSIAVELVANPSIIFLDEPTSGLVRGRRHSVPKLEGFSYTLLFPMTIGCSCRVDCNARFEENRIVWASCMCDHPSTIDCDLQFF